MDLRGEGDADRWSSLIWAAIAGGADASARAVAGAMEVFDRIGSFAPTPVPELPKCLDGARPLRALLDEAELEQWAAHQLAVTSVEAENAGKLSALLWALTVMRKAAERGDETAPAIAARLAKLTHRMYPRLADCLMGDPLPESAVARRRLVVDATRELDLWPVAWRTLNGQRQPKRERGGEPSRVGDVQPDLF